MSRKETLLREAARLAAEEKKRRGNRPPDEPYSTGGMDCESMPFGCWLVIAAALVGLYFLLKKFFGL